MHAGELTLGLVQPDLTSHISDAVYTAGANRIGLRSDGVRSKIIRVVTTWQKIRWPSKSI
jgi:hypothetical protein